ncbi:MULTISPECIES: ArsR/SmtB family transcription factor [unclassified Brachybacterium]|uniref:ArsR/SmtB family transcription factor n=1 Tax=unclassified Brachybacterium TaxID=2623841 RepID=UPI003F98AB9C
MRFVLTPGALARTRFVVSPLAELVGALSSGVTALEEPRRARPQPSSAPSRTEGLDLAALRRWRTVDPLHTAFTDLIAHTKWFPDLVGLAPPATGEVRLVGELAQIAAWDPQAAVSTIEDSVAAAWTPQQTAWLAAPDLPGRIAAALGSAWEQLIAADWPRRQRILRREIAFRTALIGTTGWAGAVDGIARDVAWEDPDALLVSRRVDRSLTVSSHLCFVPTTQVRGRWTCDGPVGVALVYGARGSRAAVSPRTGRALGRLLGTGRAAVLLALDLPATPSQLHAELGYALGTVGGHLAVLEGAGLVHRARTGREVHYRRTELGEALVGKQG